MVDTQALALHKKLKGKIEVHSKIPLTTKKQLSLAYTPGVAAVSQAIARQPKLVKTHTIKQNTVAVVTDGSAVLGLGNIGPEAALPVMEGKAALFKQYANIDAFPICLATQNTKEIIQTVKHIAPVFGGINLEDISAPRCFDVENKLQNIGIPVMHDDQHGTAVVLLAGLLNAAKLVNKKIDDLKIVVNGAGAAGTAITKLLTCADIDSSVCKATANVILCDSKGIIHKKRKDLHTYKKSLAQITNKHNNKGTLAEALHDADVFIGVSKGNLLTKHMIKTMNAKPIIFALANPTPEIMPNLAKQAGAAIVATGRSDFPNQVNNVLAFPGIFRGALDTGATRITEYMKLHAAYALARTVKRPTSQKILPSVFDKHVVSNITKAVKTVVKQS